MSLNAETVAERIRAGVFRVASIERDAVRRDPVPPFTPATLQQKASRRVGFGVRKTMSVAQGLHEGGGRPRASAVAAALRTFGFGAAPPGAGLARALLVLSVLLVTATAAHAQTTLVSNAGENRDNFVVAGDSASGRITQGFTTGSNTAGYDLSSVGIYIHGDTSSSTETLTVSVHRFDSNETNNLGELVAALSTPSRLIEGAVNDFTAPSNTRLLPNTRYLVNIVGEGNNPYDFQIGATLSDAETGAAGWLIEDAFRLNGSIASYTPYAIMMNVKGSNRILPLIPTLDSAEAFFVNGALRYQFDLRLSEGVSIPYREMRDHAFSVANGRMDGAVRIHKERTGGNLYSNHWRMRVAPVDETKPVTVTLRGNRPCSEKGALCTGSGGQLDGSPALTLSTDTEPPDLGSLPSLSIADTSSTEDSANLAFDVSLSKAVSATITVDFQTVSGGTATANADYQEASYRIVFSAGETVQPGSVALMEDAAADAGETVNVEIANARVITPRGAEFGPLSITTGQATGTIDAPASGTTPLPNVNMRIEDTRGSESGGWLHFTIKLSRALDEYVCYDFESGGSLAASEADVTRLRLGLEGTWRGLGTLVPTLEVGARHDGGDAETGFGADIGARLVWADPSLGMRAELAARGLLTHEDGSLSERGFAGSLAWDPSPDTDRGPMLTLRQAIGAEATGGMDALLRPETARVLAAANDDGPGRRRLEARLGYGFALLGGSWTGVPEVGFGLTEASREYIHAWRLQEARETGLVFGLDVEGARNERLDGDAAPEHRVGLGLGWELAGARREDLALRLEASRLLPANDNPENHIGVRLTARW